MSYFSPNHDLKNISSPDHKFLEILKSESHGKFFADCKSNLILPFKKEKGKEEFSLTFSV